MSCLFDLNSGRHIHIHCPAKERVTLSNILIFCWTAFSFDNFDATASISLCKVTTFISVQSCNHFFAKILYWWWESQAAAESPLQHIPKILNEILLLSLWNIAVGYTVDFLLFDFTKHPSDLRSYKIFFFDHISFSKMMVHHCPSRF